MADGAFLLGSEGGVCGVVWLGVPKTIPMVGQGDCLWQVLAGLMKIQRSSPKNFQVARRVG